RYRLRWRCAWDGECAVETASWRKTLDAAAWMRNTWRQGGSGRAMAAEHPAGNEEDGVAARVIATPAALPRSERSGVPKAFVDALFSQAVPEDVVRYDARELATLAESAWAFLAKRKSGAPKIRFENPADGAGERLRQISVLEIANDDMPFLVDSV